VAGCGVAHLRDVRTGMAPEVGVMGGWGYARARAPALAQGVALTFGACTWCPWNKIAATWVIVSVPAR
jgi:hypothetical protein